MMVDLLSRQVPRIARAEIRVAVKFAKAQRGHGSERRTGEIMKELVSYGTAARSAIPELKELIGQFNTPWPHELPPPACRASAPPVHSHP